MPPPSARDPGSRPGSFAADPRDFDAPVSELLRRVEASRDAPSQQAGGGPARAGDARAARADGAGRERTRPARPRRPLHELEDPEGTFDEEFKVRDARSRSRGGARGGAGARPGARARADGRCRVAGASANRFFPPAAETTETRARAATPTTRPGTPGSRERPRARIDARVPSPPPRRASNGRRRRRVATFFAPPRARGDEFPLSVGPLTTKLTFSLAFFSPPDNNSPSFAGAPSSSRGELREAHHRFEPPAPAHAQALRPVRPVPRGDAPRRVRRPPPRAAQPLHGGGVSRDAQPLRKPHLHRHRHPPPQHLRDPLPRVRARTPPGPRAGTVPRVRGTPAGGPDHGKGHGGTGEATAGRRPLLEEKRRRRHGGDGGRRRKPRPPRRQP